MERSTPDRHDDALRGCHACGVALFFCAGLLMLAGFAAALAWITCTAGPSDGPEHVGGSHAWDEERR